MQNLFTLMPGPQLGQRPQCGMSVYDQRSVFIGIIIP